MQVPSSGQPQRVRIARQVLDLASGPLEVGAAPCGFQVQSIGSGAVGSIRVNRRVEQPAINLRMRLNARIEERQFPQDFSLTPQCVRRESAVPVRLRRIGMIGRGVDLSAIVDAE